MGKMRKTLRTRTTGPRCFRIAEFVPPGSYPKHGIPRFGEHVSKHVPSIGVKGCWVESGRVEAICLIWLISVGMRLRAFALLSPLAQPAHAQPLGEADPGGNMCGPGAQTQRGADGRTSSEQDCSPVNAAEWTCFPFPALSSPLAQSCLRRLFSAAAGNS
jgi:hypothetical protein